MLRTIFGLKREEATRGLRKSDNNRKEGYTIKIANKCDTAHYVKFLRASKIFQSVRWANMVNMSTHFFASSPLWSSSWENVVLDVPQQGEVFESVGNGMLSSTLTLWCHPCRFCWLQVLHSPCRESTSNLTAVPWAQKETGPCAVTKHLSLHSQCINVLQRLWKENTFGQKKKKSTDIQNQN